MAANYASDLPVRSTPCCSAQLQASRLMKASRFLTESNGAATAPEPLVGNSIQPPNGLDGSGSFCIMKDDTDRMALSAADAAHAMAHIDPILALRSFDRPIVNSERDCVTLAEGHDLDPALHTRALLGQHELSAGEIAPRF